jgi:hypothetical protein
VSESLLTIRLVLAYDGVFHEETIQVPAEALARYDRLIDLLREDEDLLKRHHVDLARLAVAEVVEDRR